MERYIRKTSEKLEISTSLLNQEINKLTDELEHYRLQHIEKQQKQKNKKRELTPQRTQQAKKYLEEPNLLERTNNDISKTGIIGEENNRLLMYLIFTGRLRQKPLHIITLGSSGSGKTHLQEKISELIPEQHKLEITDLSDNALYYFEKKELKHKLIIIEDLKGAENVMYVIRELQTKKRINKTVAMKTHNGKPRTINLEVEGPICLSATTTMEKLYEDNANRSILIYRDESPNHQKEVMANQRQQSAGKTNQQEQEQIKELFKDIQTILKPIKIINPYAEYLTIPPEVFKPLRTNEHYLLFIETLTFYHQYQRQHKKDKNTGETYIETTIEDIENANKLLKEVLLNKSDELTKACRTFFENIKKHLQNTNTINFYTKDLRQHFRMHPSKIKRYLLELQRYNYIKIIGGNRYKQGYEYQITEQDQYNNLQKGVENALDQALKTIKEKKQWFSSSPVVQTQNRPLNDKKISQLTPVVQ